MDYYYYDGNGYYDYNNSDIEENGTELTEQGERLYLYTAYAFERVVYLYIWEILVIVTCILNTVVISVLLRRNMRNNSPNIILMAISVSDTLTCLVTLPSYIVVFQQYASSTSTNQGLNMSSLNTSNLSPDDLDYVQALDDIQTSKFDDTPMDVYLLTETLCDGLMISKFFMSKIFHVSSIWLTLTLGFQRFLSLYKPYYMRREVSPFTIRRTLFICMAIFATAPCLHLYRLVQDKSNDDCTWSVDMGMDCGSDCVYFWLVLLVENILPSLILTLFSIYIIFRIVHTTRVNGRKIETLVTDRRRTQRKTSIMIMVVVVVFLTAEIPYTIFHLQNALRASANLPLNLESNRRMYVAYDLIMVLSFNANFFIYTIFNKQFRDVLKTTLTTPLSNILRLNFHSKKHIVDFELQPA